MDSIKLTGLAELGVGSILSHWQPFNENILLLLSHTHTNHAPFNPSVQKRDQPFDLLSREISPALNANYPIIASHTTLPRLHDHSSPSSPKTSRRFRRKENKSDNCRRLRAAIRTHKKYCTILLETCRIHREIRHTIIESRNLSDKGISTRKGWDGAENRSTRSAGRWGTTER